MIINATKQVADNIREEFAGIHKELLRLQSSEITVDYAREIFSQHVPTMVTSRIQFLLDVLLNYLMEDAIASLAHAPTDIKNNFYALNIRACLKGSFKLEPQDLQFSVDPRFVAGGVAAGGTLVTGGVIIGLFLGGITGRIIAGLATIVASAIAFRIAHTACTEIARKKLNQDISTYLSQSEEQASDLLKEIESAFIKAFDQFVTEHGIRAENAS